MKPIAPGWNRIPDTAHGARAYWNRELGMYTLCTERQIEISKQGYRPSLDDCKQVLSGFGASDAVEVLTGREVFRKFELAAPFIFGKQVDLFD